MHMEHSLALFFYTDMRTASDCTRTQLPSVMEQVVKHFHMTAVINKTTVCQNI